MRLSLVVLCLIQLAWLPRVEASSEARAAPPRPLDVRAQIEDAVQLSLDADFEAALAAFDRLLVAQQLDDDSLVRVLSERAMVLYALDRPEALAEDLQRLAQIEPATHMSDRAPPALVERWLSIAGTSAPLVHKSAGARASKQSARRTAVGPYARTATERGTAPPPALEPSETTFTRPGWWIGGALVTAAAVVAVSLALTVPSSPRERTAIQPHVEF